MEQNRTVVHVIGGGEFGGAEQHILQLLTLLPHYGLKGKVVCFYEAGFSHELRNRGIEVEVLKFDRFDFRLLSGLREVFEREQPLIIHTHGVKANFFGRLAARKFPHIPLVTTIHSLLRFDYTNQLAYFFAYRMEKWTRSFTDRFIAVSRSIADYLQEEGIESKKISVIHHGIDVDQFSQGKAVLRDELGLSPDDYLIGVVSRLVKIKGMDYAISAMPKILQANPRAHLVIVGSGPEEAELKAAVEQHHVTGHVHFVGFRKDIANCLHSFDCFVSASLSEGLGLNILEAMAASLPVVVTGVGGVIDFTQDRKNGLLIEPQSSEDIAIKVIELMNNPGFAKSLAEEAFRQVEQSFSLHAMLTNTVRLYEQILEETDG
ncbi:glycosyltransferase [Ammoniphilus sp. CFH 90114]|uniref:glycosyltransferase n=1 Tax=Ammoniphilus sp. CFH 90114 TaxID=2493665 RepID=UPI00101003E1|nr:glycosyltransferase [Ammoniphilus sp. CFH 90114]RXT14642.1 glycosyltransferase family 1 protein [Ammoniphilus sp. CFH 90114]